jgi:hypothetical protein
MKMFEQKDRIRYISEGMRNIGVAQIAGAMIAYSTGHTELFSSILFTHGFLDFYFGYLLLKD